MNNETTEELKMYESLSICGIVTLLIGVLVGGFLCFMGVIYLADVGGGLIYIVLGVLIVLFAVISYFIMKALAILVKNSAK